MHVKYTKLAGAIDGTHINVEAPRAVEDTYLNKDGDHSVQAQVVCGPTLYIYDAFCNYGGSAHDARVLRASPLFRAWENGYRPFPSMPRVPFLAIL